MQIVKRSALHEGCQGVKGVEMGRMVTEITRVERPSLGVQHKEKKDDGTGTVIGVEEPYVRALAKGIGELVATLEL